MFARIVAALAALLCASQAYAAKVYLTFSASGLRGGYAQDGPNVYLDDQNAFIAQASSANVSFNFQFSYDPTLSAPNYGLTLISGTLGTMTDFSGFTAGMEYAPNNHMLLWVSKSATAGSSTYTTGAYFTVQDNDGQLGTTPPMQLDIPAIDGLYASFEVRRSGGVGQGYKIASYGTSLGISDGLAVGVPELEIWAMMLAGFGMLGAAMRRQQTRPATA